MTRRRSILLLATLSSLFLFDGNAGSCSQDDMLSEALRRYRQESSALRERHVGGRARREFYQHWLADLLELAEANPDSPHYAPAMWTAMSLANGTEQWDLSERLARKLLFEHHTWQWKADLYAQLGSICRNKYAATKEAEDGRAAISYLRRSVALIEDQRHEAMQTDQFGFQYVENLGQIADLLEKTAQDPAEAAAAYRRARLSLPEVPESARSRAERLGYSAEFLGHREMLQWIAAGEQEESRQALDALRRLPEARRPASYYQHQWAVARFPAGGEQFRRTLEDWLGEQPEDDWTPYLLWHLARDHYREGNYFAAARIYQRLDSDYLQLLLAEDKEPLQRGRGGHVSFVLYNLAQCYAALEMPGHAVPLYERFLKLFPDDSRAANAEEQLLHLRARLAEEQQALLSHSLLVPQTGAERSSARGSRAVAKGGSASESAEPPHLEPATDLSENSASTGSGANARGVGCDWWLIATVPVVGTVAVLFLIGIARRSRGDP